MSLEKLFLSFLLGFLTGLFYFHHLYISLKRSLSKGKRKTGFLLRFSLLSLLLVPLALYFKESFLSFPLGFFLSRLTYSLFLLRIGKSGDKKEGGS